VTGLEDLKSYIGGMIELGRISDVDLVPCRVLGAEVRGRNLIVTMETRLEGVPETRELKHVVNAIRKSVEHGVNHALIIPEIRWVQPAQTEINK